MKNAVRIILIITLVHLFGCGSGKNKNSIQASGNIESTNVILSAKVGGQIVKLYFTEGDKVKKGDTLLVIDSESLRIQLQQAAAAREFAEAQLQLLKKGARKEDIQQAEAMLKQSEINLDQAKRDKQRMDQLHGAKTISEKQYEDALDRYNVMRQQYKSAKENYDKLKFCQARGNQTSRSKSRSGYSK